MSSFPLLTLPEEVCETVFELFNLGELFALSQCSKKQLENVKARAKVFDDPLYLSVSVSSTCHVELRDFEQPGQKISWNFYHPKNVQLADVENPKTFKVNEEDMDFYQVYHPCHFGTSSTITPLNLLKFAEHVTELFDGTLWHVVVHLTSSEIPFLEVLEAIRSIPLFLNGKVSIRHGRVHHEEMRYILDNFHGKLELGCQPDEGFVYEKPISAKVLNDSDYWLTRDMLLRLDCERISLNRSEHLKSEDLNEFMHNWMNGRYPKLRYLSLTIGSSSSEAESLPSLMTKLLKGLPAIPGSPKGDEGEKFQDYFPAAPFEEGMDLRRESDGGLATVALANEFHSNCAKFFFIVWKEQGLNNVVP